MREKRAFSCLSIFTVLLVLSWAGVSLWGTTGKIAGRIVDTESGEPLPFANVIVEGTSMGAASDFDGYYVMLNIPPGAYTLRASMIGYQSMRIENINVSLDLTTTVDFQLQSQVIALGEAITVTAERQMVVKDLTASTAIVEAKQMEALPITEVSEALQLQAGIVDRDGLHLRGGRSGEIAYWIDGVPVTDVYDGNQVVEVGKGMVQEMQLVSGAYNAEYGQAMSGIVNIATKQGSNEFSGSITGYIGDYASDNDHIFRAISRVDPFAIRNFEGNLSGAIIKDKLFFFVNGRGIHFDGWQYGQRRYDPSAVTGPLFELENTEVDSFPVERIPSWYWDLEEIDSSDYVRCIWEEDECVDTVVYDLPVYGLPTWYLEAFAPEYLSLGRATDAEGHFQSVQYILGSNAVIDSHLVINDWMYEEILDAIIPPEHRNNPDTIAAYTGEIVDYFRQVHKGGMGDGEYVPMNWSEKLYNQTKLIYKITPQAQLSYNFIYDGVDYRDYERMYQYNPDGDVERHRRGYVNILKFTHTLNSKVFYESSLSYFLKRYWHSVYDNRDDTSYVHDYLLIDLDPYSFHTGGTNNQRFKRDTKTWLGKTDWTAQVTRIHQLKWGTEVRHHSLFFEDITVQPDSLEIDKNLFWENP
ncbi:MAG: TonB-dependent receptor [Gemmatimonadota bacterium]|nr:MAG: TonB-dependent receptor [Gemmatimonadota bacterium]